MPWGHLSLRAATTEALEPTARAPHQGKPRRTEALASLLPSASSLCSPHDRPMNPRDKVPSQGRDFNRGADRPRRWQASTSK